MYSSPQYTFLAPSGDQDPIPVRPTYPPQADRVRGPRQPSDHRLSIHAARLSDQSQSSRPSFHQSHSYPSEGRSPPITRESSQGQAPLNPHHHHPQQHHSAHREQHHHQPAHRDERHRPISSHSAFDPLNYHGPSAYNHLSLPLASRDDGPKRPEDFDPDHKAGAYRPLHLSGTDSRLSQQQTQYDQARRRLPWFLRPWQTAFEAPSKANIALLLFCCAVSYTLVWIVPSIITRRIEMSLYWARAVVNAATSIAGFIITLALTEIAHRILYSAIWTAVILEEDMTLNDLDQIADRIGVISGLRLLWIKFRAGTKRFAGASRRAEQSDKASIHGSRSRFRRATWGIEVPASLGLLLLASAFGFSADRTLKISVELRAQNDMFDAISVGGDLSAADVTAAAALQPFFDNFVRTWTLQSTAALKLPSTVKLALPGQSEQYAYFTEVLPDNFLPDFEGYGSFSNDTHTSSNNAAVAPGNSSWKPESPDSWTTIIGGGGGSDSDGEETTVLRNVRWPRWGVQARCQRLQNLGQYFVPDISQTPDAMVSDRLSVLFLTRAMLSSVLSALDVPLPSTLQTALDLNMSYGDLNKVLPAGLNAADVAIAHPFYANGVAQAFFSRPIMAEDEINPDASVPDAYKNTPGSAGRGWSSLEIVLIRLKPELAGPGAQFGMVANVTDNNGNFGDVGFDVGVCVERFDPFLVEVFQGKSIQSSRIISQAADFTSQKGMPRSSQVSAGSATNLNSTGKFPAYSVAHDNARNALLKDNGRDASWVPNPTLTSMSSGAEGGPAGYGRLDPERLADMLASADTRLLLPYLVGRGKVEARSYDLKQIARVSCIVSWLNIVFGVIIGCGLLGIFFVPRLPAGLPRRSTSPISWLVAFSGAGALRIGSTPAGAVLSGRSSANPDRKSASGSFASFHHLSHDPSRLSTMSGGTAAADDDEQRLLRGEGFHPRLADGRMLVGGAWITLDEIEKRLGKKPVSYALPDNTVRPYGGESMVGTPWDSQPVLTYRPPS